MQVAHDGKAALRMLAAFAPQVAILDIGLPLMDGHFGRRSGFRGDAVRFQSKLACGNEWVVPRLFSLALTGTDSEMVEFGVG